jgi:hypothetical protein
MRQDHRRDPFTVIHNPLRSAQLVFKVREAVEGRPTPFAFSPFLLLLLPLLYLTTPRHLFSPTASGTRLPRLAFQVNSVDFLHNSIPSQH